MPLQFVPRESGRHRIACIALYRALLTHTTQTLLPLKLPSQGAVNPIKHVIRKEFRRYLNHTSSRIIVEALKRGYAAEALLRTASLGSKESLDTIHSHLWKLHDQRVLARSTCAPPPPRPPRPCVWPYPDAPKVILTRPIPLKDLPSARRVVPALAVGTSGVPFMRIKKPMSPFLSRVIKDKATQRQVRLDLLMKLESEVLFAGDEERWVELFARRVEEEEKKDDGRMKRSMAGDSRGLLETGWTEEVVKAERSIEKDLSLQRRQWLGLGTRMGQIVQEEKLLARMERAERRKGKAKVGENNNGPEGLPAQKGVRDLPRQAKYVRIVDNPKKY